MTWQSFEERVREIARLRWDCNATSETVDGVKCDCVLKPSSEEWILVEITQERDLDKVRRDVLKLAGIRLAQFQKNILCRCYIVLEESPTDSMRAYGDSNKVRVKSITEFQNEYFNYSNYVYVRSHKQFGSLISLLDGRPETNVYINVSYRNRKTGELVTIDKIIELLRARKKIVLLGDFGLGKSRCIKQLFDQMSSDPINNPYVIAINLRDHWGMRKGVEILRRHFEDLGLDARNYIKNYERPNAIYLLDGFDEIGSQSWNSSAEEMKRNRANSVLGIKDLLSRVDGGAFIAGREYYFNSDKEMCTSLGLDEESTIILECNPEFLENEIVDFIQKNIAAGMDTGIIQQLPTWLPKRPLVIQLLLKYAGDIFSVEYVLNDIYSFWDIFLSKICYRESEIYPSLDADTIKGVMIELANKTRTSKSNTGPISFNEMAEAFNTIAGYNPTDESITMLQRLPTLGRVSADTPDRQFLDAFILNGLRVEHIIQLSKQWDPKVFDAEWKYPMDQIGLNILSAYIEQEPASFSLFLELARNAAQRKNIVLACDIISALCMVDCQEIDFKDIYIYRGHFAWLSFEGKKIRRLQIADSSIDILDLTNSKLEENAYLRGCVIGKACGIASGESLSSNESFPDCEVDEVDTLATAALIKKAPLSKVQKAFLQILKMIFLQPGKGRMESALMRGVGTQVDKTLCEHILRILIEEDLIFKHKGDEGYVYNPVRKYTSRVKKIMSDMTLSTDPLWERISKLH